MPAPVEQADRLLISAAGYERRCRDLDAWRVDERRELTRRLLEARADGNAAENPRVHELLDEQLRLEQRIAVLEAQLAAAEIVEPAADGRAGIGTIVRVRDDAGATFDYELVGSLESDVANGRVSVAAPIGRALDGRPAGARVDVAAPAGAFALEILSVRPVGLDLREAA